MLRHTGVMPKTCSSKYFRDAEISLAVRRVLKSFEQQVKAYRANICLFIILRMIQSNMASLETETAKCKRTSVHVANNRVRFLTGTVNKNGFYI